MKRTMVLTVLVLGASLAGCTHPEAAPQESIVGTTPPAVHVSRNDAWRASDVGFVKILVVNVTASAPMSLSWQDFLLNVTDGTMGPTSAYELRADNYTIGAAAGPRFLDANGTIAYELHYRANATDEPTSGWYDFSTGPVSFELPPATRAT